MNVEELKQYLKNNLRLDISRRCLDYNEVKLVFTLYLDNEEITEEYVYIKEGE